jgi:hypothetical protein
VAAAVRGEEAEAPPTEAYREGSIGPDGEKPSTTIHLISTLLFQLSHLNFYGTGFHVFFLHVKNLIV